MVSRRWSTVDVLSGRLFLLLAAYCSLLTVRAQVNPPFDLSHSVIASGGGSNSTGSSGGQTFRIDGTVWQNLAGTLSTGPNGQGGRFLVCGGFWGFHPVAPTATLVSVGGRVSTETGLAIYNARVYLTDSSGTIRAAVTSDFGYYRIDGVEVGQTYVVTAVSPMQRVG